MVLRVDREKEFHNNRFSKEVREPTVKYYKITKIIHENFRSEIFNNCKNKNILELGCSKGAFSIEMAKHGANILGIDISDVAIELAKENSKNSGFQNNCEFIVKDASELDFLEKSFDKVVGGAILHHLNFESALISINKILMIDGEAIFIEPLGYNPIINLYRKLTPKFRTEDEKPLTNEELKLFSKYFNSVEITPYFLTALLAVPFTKLIIFDKIVSILNMLDKIIFKIKFMQKFAWQVLIKVSLPKTMVE